jgi:hypothetical protein|nr:hypothetical protein [Nitrosomonas nitrosa]
MVTFEQFLWLVHYALVAYYGWEITFFAINRITQSAAFDQVHPDAIQKLFDEYGSVMIGLVGWHCMVYGFYVRAVPVVLLIYAGFSMYCGLKNEAVKPFLQKGRGRRWRVSSSEEKENPERRGPWNRSSGEDEGDYTFKRDRFKSASSDGGASSTYDAEADYQNALHEAQKWADQAASRENAQRWADKFEQLADNPSLHAKDKLRYRLAAMLLRERLKGQGSAPPGGSNADPTDAEVALLGLPVPQR